jgi:preprotein translocase subunit Sec61beta
MTEPLAKRQLREGLEMLLSAGVLEFETETEATR